MAESFQSMQLYSTDKKKTEYVTTAVLGAGIGGTVWAAVRTRDGEQVAIKSPQPDTLEEHEKEKAAFKLIKRQQSNDNVLQMLDLACIMGENVPTHIVLERCNYSLYDAVAKGPTGDDKFRIEVASQIYNGLSFLHKNNLAHTDMALRNVLVHKAQGCVKICDFGGSESLIRGEAEKIRYKCDDLTKTARCVVAFLWLHCEVFNCHALREDLAMDVECSQAAFLKAKAFILGRGRDRLSEFISKDHSWWESSFRDIEGHQVKACMLAIHAKQMRTFNTHRSGTSPVPDNVIKALEISCLLATFRAISAATVHQELHQLLTGHEHDEARRSFLTL